MSMIILGISLILVVFAWTVLWQKTLLDTTRDRLFEIRDEARDWFISNGYALNHPIYRATRNILNIHLRHTEAVSLTSYIAYLLYSKSNEDEDALIEKHITEQFNCDDEKINKFIDDVRQRASLTLLRHMCERNFLIISLVAVLAFFIGTKRFVQKIYEDIFKPICCGGKMQKRVFASFLISVITCLPFIGARTPHQNRMTMEKYSFAYEQSPHERRIHSLT